MKQDSLYKRIESGKPITVVEGAELAKEIGRGCSCETKFKILLALERIHYHPEKNYGIYRRVHLNPVGYCAGQSYPDEIRTVRKCILGK